MPSFILNSIQYVTHFQILDPLSAHSLGVVDFLFLFHNCPDLPLGVAVGDHYIRPWFSVGPTRTGTCIKDDTGIYYMHTRMLMKTDICFSSPGHFTVVAMTVVGREVYCVQYYLLTIYLEYLLSYCDQNLIVRRIHKFSNELKHETVKVLSHCDV